MFFQPLIYAFIFVGVFMMVEGIYLVIYGKMLKREKKINRRLALLEDGKDTEEVLSILRLEREGAEKHEKIPVIGPLVEMARHAAIALTISQIVIALVGLTVRMYGDFNIHVDESLEWAQPWFEPPNPFMVK